LQVQRPDWIEPNSSPQKLSNLFFYLGVECIRCVDHICHTKPTNTMNENRENDGLATFGFKLYNNKYTDIAEACTHRREFIY